MGERITDACTAAGADYLQHRGTAVARRFLVGKNARRQHYRVQLTGRWRALHSRILKNFMRIDVDEQVIYGTAVLRRSGFRWKQPARRLIILDPASPDGED